VAPSKPTRQARDYTDAERAGAVARVVAGESVHAVARSVGAQPSTVRAWRARAGGDPQKTDPDYRALVLHYLQESLAAGERVLGQTRNQAWLDKQPAGELAVFLGVVLDKVVRLLDGLAAAERPPAPAALPGGGGGGADS
jgi:hypothetical protein